MFRGSGREPESVGQVAVVTVTLDGGVAVPEPSVCSRHPRLGVQAF